MKIICVGRNYVDHAHELNNPVPDRPLIFMKPSTALLIDDKPLYFPDFTQDLHYEGEIVLKISKNGRHIQPAFARSYFDEIAFGIDFTARDLQDDLKRKGQPWELAKAFDHSAALSGPVALSSLENPDEISFHLNLNGNSVQTGNTKDLIFSFEHLICFVSRYFRLQIGDYIFTGTPAGVGSLKVGDLLEGFIEGRKLLSCEIK